MCNIIRIRNLNSFSPQFRNNLDVDNLEAIWIELFLKKTKPIIVGCVYRPPKNRNFLDEFKGVLSKIGPQCERIVLGDFNICELHEQSHFLKENRGILTGNTMCQLIKEPTRVTDRTATLLDHILVSREDVIQQSGVVPICISDHELIYCTRKITHQRFGGHVTIRSRSLKHYSKDLLLESLNKTDWVPVLSCLDTNVAWQTFESCMKTIVDSLAPQKQRRIKSNSEPWVNAEILESIRERNTSLHKFRKSKDAQDYGEYRKHRNMVQCLAKKGKTGVHIEDQLKANEGDSKKTWKTLQSLGYSNKSRNREPMVLKINGEMCHNQVEIANHVNNFFCKCST